jgi:hypothetical protein
MIYFALVRSTLEYAAVAWSSVAITYANKLDRMQRQFAALCRNKFPKIWNHYDNLLERLNLLTLHPRKKRVIGKIRLKWKGIIKVDHK